MTVCQKCQGYKTEHMETVSTSLLPCSCCCHCADSPMGVSQWREYGKKYGYWSYFEDLIKDLTRKCTHETITTRMTTDEKKRHECQNCKMPLQWEVDDYIERPDWKELPLK